MELKDSASRDKFIKKLVHHLEQIYVFGSVSLDASEMPVLSTYTTECIWFKARSKSFYIQRT